MGLVGSRHHGPRISPCRRQGLFNQDRLTLADRSKANVATEGWRCDNHDSLHAWIGNHGTVIVVDRNGSARQRLLDPPAANGGETNSRQIVQQMLNVTAAMPTNSDKTYSQFRDRSLYH
jgi:hypothetical protein